MGRIGEGPVKAGTETEYKIMVGEADFYRFMREMEEDGRFAQSRTLNLNYYYDDDRHTLHEGDVTLRVRRRGPTLKLELKTPHDAPVPTGGVQGLGKRTGAPSPERLSAAHSREGLSAAPDPERRAELSVPITEMPLSFDVKGSPFEALLPHVGRVSLRGQLVTDRIAFVMAAPEDDGDPGARRAPGLEVAFDVSYYLGEVDHEIEVEFHGSRAEEARLLAERYAGCAVGHVGAGAAPRMGKRDRLFRRLTEMAGYPPH